MFSLPCNPGGGMTGSCCFEAYTGVDYREEAGGRVVMWSLRRRIVSEMYEQGSERETNANSALQQYSQYRNGDV
jgi:hypothetical protein